ncbi:MAG: TolC family protein [Burkholderiaceae bacterium]|nr:TolC family protein [Burkholderiaceae bacterium]
MKLLTTGLLAAALAGCSTPQLPSRRDLALDAKFANQPVDAEQGEPAGRFWERFGDPQLNALVARASEVNHDLRIATANLQEARALARDADAQRWPQVNAVAAAGRLRDRMAPGRSLYVVGFDAAWEADLFGRLSGAQDAARATVRATEADLQAVRLSLTAEVARTYFDLRGLQERLRVSQAALKTQETVLRLVQARYESGRGVALDAERARALAETTAASIPVLETALMRARYRLAVLCGQAPTALDTELMDARPLPGLRSVPLGSVGSPESLLMRRPEVRAALHAAAAAAAQAGVARSALLPRITLGGTIGQNASQPGNLLDGSAYVYNLGAQLVWNMLDFGRVRAQIAAADARVEAVLAAWERTVLTALEETEAALATYTRTQQQAERLFEAARSAEAAARIARARFDAGVIDFLVVLDAERELLAARDRLALSQSNAATSLVGVYKALAGDLSS